MVETRKHKKKLKGGNKNLRFRYTKNSNRIKWTEKLYPYGYQLMKQISKKIPWESYKFEGDSQIAFFDEEGEVKELKDVSGTAVLPNPPYIILGGAACEVLDHSYNKLVKLSNYVDPTSDIDILLSTPIFKTNDKQDDDYSTVLYDSGYTNLTDDYSKWLFNHVVTVMEEFSSNVKLPSLSKTTPTNTNETREADLFKSVGPFLVSRLYRGDIIKIQITTTVGSYSEHICEFILDTNKIIQGSETPNKKSYYHIDDLYVEQPYKLLLGQLKALINRQKGFEESSPVPKNFVFRESNEKNLVHKVYNHCGRIIYLAKLLKELHNKKIETYVSISGLFHTIKKDLIILKSGFCDKIFRESLSGKDFFKTFIECFSDFPSYNTYVKGLL